MANMEINRFVGVVNIEGDVGNVKNIQRQKYPENPV